MKRRIIDIHNHPCWLGHNIDKTVHNMDELGIEKTWLLAWELPKNEFAYCSYYNAYLDPRGDGTGAPLELVVEGLQKYPDRFIGGWTPDPRDPNGRAKLKSAVDLHGIKVYGELKCRMRYDDPDAIMMFRYCAELGLPVVFHLQWAANVPAEVTNDVNKWLEWYGGDMTCVENMCRLCPDTQFIGHGPGFWLHISGGVDESSDGYPFPKGPVKTGGKLPELMRKHNNLHCDLSGGSGRTALQRDPQHAEKFLAEFQDRIMYGRDEFTDKLSVTLTKLSLSDDMLDKICFRNAQAMISG